MQLHYIHTGWLIDGTGQMIQKDMVLTIQNDTIVSIDPFNKELSKKITHHLSNFTVFPPLIDAHVHLSMSGTLDLDQRQAQLNLNVVQAQHLITRHLNQYHQSGIVAVRDGGDHFGHTYHLKHTVNHKVVIHSPGVAWYKKGRYGKFVGKVLDSGKKGLQDIQSYRKIDHIKIIQSGINSVKQFGKQTVEQFSLTEMTAICQWALKHQKKVMVHANGVDPVAIAIQSGCTSIEHGYFMGQDNLKKMADQQIFWTPTLTPMVALSKYLTDPKEKDIARRTVDHQFEQMTLARNYGVPVICGSDAGSYGVNHGKGLISEIRLFVECGYSLSQAIQSCTSLSNKLLGIKFPGILKKGMHARFIQKQGNPSIIYNCQ
jgi:imidazolonepropionase-like amidohydrolase